MFIIYIRTRCSLDPELNKARNPIIDAVDKEFRSSCRKTQYSDKSSINFEKNDGNNMNELQWKPSVKYII